ncbi:MAG: alkyl sulfatase C-terminal domain-containing protein, partial [Ilumatobacteraceae bacterium]
LSVVDLDERWVVFLSNRALSYVAGRHDAAADVTITAARETLLALGAGEMALADAVASGAVTAAGDAAALGDIIDHLDVFTGGFGVIEP